MLKFKCLEGNVCTLFICKHLQVLIGLFAKLDDLLSHPCGILFILVLAKLLGTEFLGFWKLGEPGKQEWVGWIVEELVLGLPTVLVHGLSHNGEIEERVLQVWVIFIVSVGEHKDFDQINEFKLSFFVQRLKQSLEGGLSEFDQRALNLFVLLLLGLPLLEEGFVGVLEEDCHGSEASALEVKVEVHVVFRLVVVLGGDLLSFGLRKTFFLGVLLFRGINHCDVWSLGLLFLIKFKRFFEFNSGASLCLALLVLTLVFLGPFTVQSLLGNCLFVGLLVYCLAFLQDSTLWLGFLFLFRFDSTVTFNFRWTHVDQMKVWIVNTGLGASILNIVQRIETREVRWEGTVSGRCCKWMFSLWFLYIFRLNWDLSDR